MRLFLAIRVFFKTLFDPQFAPQVQQILRADHKVAATVEPTLPARPKPAPLPTRSDAITLLATLQREARFVDIVMEPHGGYSDAQIGAAARDVLSGCRKVLDRLFALKPVVEAEENSELQTPAEVDAGRYRITGNVAGKPPFKGRLVHPGWQATHCELPRWSGGSGATLVVAPVELEVS